MKLYRIDYSGPHGELTFHNFNCKAGQQNIKRRKNGVFEVETSWGGTQIWYKNVEDAKLAAINHVQARIKSLKRQLKRIDAAFHE